MTRNEWRKSRRWFSVELFTTVAEAADLTMAECAALYALSNFSNDTGRCQVSGDTARQRCRMGKTAWHSAIGSLRKKGVVRVVRTRGTNIFFIPVPGNPNATHVYPTEFASRTSQSSPNEPRRVRNTDPQSSPREHAEFGIRTYTEKGLEKGLEKGERKGCGPKAPKPAESVAPSDPGSSSSDFSKNPKHPATEPCDLVRAAAGLWQPKHSARGGASMVQAWANARGTALSTEDLARYGHQADTLGEETAALVLLGTRRDPLLSGQKPDPNTGQPIPATLALRLALGKFAEQTADLGRKVLEERRDQAWRLANAQMPPATIGPDGLPHFELTPPELVEEMLSDG